MIKNIEFEELFGRYISEDQSNNLCKDSIHICMKPKKVENTLPVCLLCVVDISGSMQLNCCNNVDGAESMYLSRLELVKHSLKTIVSTLRKDDMISVITFDHNSYMAIQPTVLINKEKKDNVINDINKISTMGATNIWAGIKLAIDTSSKISYENYQKSIMVFTDGDSNTNPPKGVFETLEDELEQSKDKFTISTFSFGNDVGPKLLIDIANLCNGIYGYCPDGTMVGTIFINYMSNLLSTITPVVKVTVRQDNNEKSTVIGPLYRGVYRNAIIKINKKYLDTTKVIVELPMTGQVFEVPLDINSPNIQTYIDEMSELEKNQNDKNADNNDDDDDDDDDDDELLDKESDDEETLKIEDIDTDAIIEEKDSEPVKYEEILLNQILRKEFIDTLSTIVKINREENERAKRILKEFYDLLNGLKYKTEFIKNLLIDIDNPDPNHGQVEKAIRSEYYGTWGECYINSFLRFHQFEQCGNFKDQSLQYYGHEVFSTYRKMANTIFVNLPPPKTEVRNYYGRGNSATLSLSAPSFQMRSFINRHGGCFNGDAIVLLANGQTKCVKDLKKGDRLNNNAIVQCLIEQTSSPSSTSSSSIHQLSTLYMCNIQGVLLTPYHPVLINDKWSFPIDLVEGKEVSIKSWFNLILMDEENKKYEVEFSNGVKAITLGHYREENSILKHPYFGTDLVLKDLKERDPVGYSQGYIFINEFNPRKLQFDNEHYCINYYKVIPETNIENPTEKIKNTFVNNNFKELVY